MSARHFLADYAQLCAHHGLCLVPVPLMGGDAAFQVENFAVAEVVAATNAEARVELPLPAVGRLLPDPIPAEAVVIKLHEAARVFSDLEGKTRARNGDAVAFMTTETKAVYIQPDVSKRPRLHEADGVRSLVHMDDPMVCVTEAAKPSEAFDYAVPSNAVLLTTFGNLAKDGEQVAEMLNDATASRFIAHPVLRPILKMVNGGRLLHHPAGVPAMHKV